MSDKPLHPTTRCDCGQRTAQECAEMPSRHCGLWDKTTRRRHEWMYPEAPSPRMCKYCGKSEWADDMQALATQEVGFCDPPKPGTTPYIAAAKRLWELWGDESFKWSELDDVEQNHWIGIAQKVIGVYRREEGKSR